MTELKTKLLSTESKTNKPIGIMVEVLRNKMVNPSKKFKIMILIVSLSSSIYNLLRLIESLNIDDSCFKFRLAYSFIDLLAWTYIIGQVDIGFIPRCINASGYMIYNPGEDATSGEVIISLIMFIIMLCVRILMLPLALIEIILTMFLSNFKTLGNYFISQTIRNIILMFMIIGEIVSKICSNNLLLYLIITSCFLSFMLSSYSYQRIEKLMNDYNKKTNNYYELIELLTKLMDYEEPMAHQDEINTKISIYNSKFPKDKLPYL
jgi:hypothetical protein